MKRVIPVRDVVEHNYVYGYLILNQNDSLEDIKKEISLLTANGDFLVDDIMGYICESFNVEYFVDTEEYIMI